MGRLPEYRRILREDLRDAPSWIDKLLTPINSFFDIVYETLNRNITFNDNIACQIKEMTFKTLSTYTSATPLTDGFEELVFKKTLPYKAQGVMIMRIYEDADDYRPITNAVSCDWYDTEGDIVINYISGLDDSTDYVVKFLVI